MEVAILVFNDIEVLDFAGPFEVFSVASRVAQRDELSSVAVFETFLFSRTGQPVTTRGGMILGPHRSLGEMAQPDVLIVPGGVMTEPLADAELIKWIRETSAITASVCTGAFILARAGLLDGLSATTHWEDIEELKQFAPRAKILSDVAFVDEGRIVTSGGISAGIDMSLHLVGRLTSPELAARTARQMAYRIAPAASLPETTSVLG
ncbi:MAG TPA: DJ-1/PfpI family protein [Acidisarcina sp.]